MTRLLVSVLAKNVTLSKLFSNVGRVMVSKFCWQLQCTLGRLLLFFVVSVAVRSAVLGEGSEKQFEASDNLVSSLIV